MTRSKAGGESATVGRHSRERQKQVRHPSDTLHERKQGRQQDRQQEPTPVGDIARTEARAATGRRRCKKQDQKQDRQQGNETRTETRTETKNRSKTGSKTDNKSKASKGKKGEEEAKPLIFLCTPIKAVKDSWRINDSVIVNGVIPVQTEVAREYGLEVIDLHTLFDASSDNMLSDGIHPNGNGAKRMAEIIYEALTARMGEKK